MPNVTDLGDGWFIDNEVMAPPYLRDPNGRRYTLLRTPQGELQLHSSASPLPYERIMSLKTAFDQWESGKPNLPLPAGWEWTAPTARVPVWVAENSVSSGTAVVPSRCFFHEGFLRAVGDVPVDVADVVMKVHRMRATHRIPPVDITSAHEPQTRLEAIRDGSL